MQVVKNAFNKEVLHASSSDISVIRLITMTNQAAVRGIVDRFLASQNEFRQF